MVVPEAERRFQLLDTVQFQPAVPGIDDPAPSDDEMPGVGKIGRPGPRRLRGVGEALPPRQRVVRDQQHHSDVVLASASIGPRRRRNEDRSPRSSVTSLYVRPRFRGDHTPRVDAVLAGGPFVRPQFRGDHTRAVWAKFPTLLSSAPNSGATTPGIGVTSFTIFLSSAPNSGATTSGRMAAPTPVYLSSAPNSGATTSRAGVTSRTAALSSAPNSGATTPGSDELWTRLALSSAPNSGATTPDGHDVGHRRGLSSAPNSGATTPTDLDACVEDDLSSAPNSGATTPRWTAGTRHASFRPPPIPGRPHPGATPAGVAATFVRPQFRGDHTRNDGNALSRHDDRSFRHGAIQGTDVPHGTTSASS